MTKGRFLDLQSASFRTSQNLSIKSWWLKLFEKLFKALKSSLVHINQV